MQNLLREFGFEPLTAASGNEAIDIARGRRPSLVLVDKRMPGMSGEEVIRALRDDEGLAQVPILIEQPDPEGRRWSQALELLLDAGAPARRRGA